MSFLYLQTKDFKQFSSIFPKHHIWAKRRNKWISGFTSKWHIHIDIVSAGYFLAVVYSSGLAEIGRWYSVNQNLCHTSCSTSTGCSLLSSCGVFGWNCLHLDQVHLYLVVRDDQTQVFNFGPQKSTCQRWHSGILNPPPPMNLALCWIIAEAKLDVPSRKKYGISPKSVSQTCLCSLSNESGTMLSYPGVANLNFPKGLLHLDELARLQANSSGERRDLLKFVAQSPPKRKMIYNYNFLEKKKTYTMQQKPNRSANINR